MSNVWNSGSRDGPTNQHPPIWLNENHPSYSVDSVTSNKYQDVPSDNFKKQSQMISPANQYAQPSYSQNFGTSSTISNYSNESNSLFNRESFSVSQSNFPTHISRDSISAHNPADPSTSIVLQAVRNLNSLGALDLDPNLISALSQQVHANKSNNHGRQTEIYSPSFNSPSPSPETKKSSADNSSKKINRARPFYEQYNAYENDDNETSLKVDDLLNRAGGGNREDRCTDIKDVYKSNDFYPRSPNQRSQSPFSYRRQHCDSDVNSVGTRTRERNKYSPFAHRRDQNTRNRSNSNNKRNRSSSEDRRVKSRSRSCDESKKKAVLALMSMSRFENKQFVKAQEPSSVLLVINLDDWITDKTLWGAIHSNSDKHGLTPPFYIETATFYLTETESKFALIAFPTITAAEICMEKSNRELDVVGRARSKKHFKMMYYNQNSLVFDFFQHKFTRLWKAVMNRRILESKEARAQKSKSQFHVSVKSYRNSISEEKDFRERRNSEKSSTESTKNDDGRFVETTIQSAKVEPEEKEEAQEQVIMSNKDSKDFSNLNETKNKIQPNIIKTNVIIGKMKSYVMKQIKGKPASEDESNTIKNITSASVKLVEQNKDTLDGTSKTLSDKETGTQNMNENSGSIENVCQFKLEKSEMTNSDDKMSKSSFKVSIHSEKSSVEKAKSIVSLDEICSPESDKELNVKDAIKKDEEVIQFKIEDSEFSSSKEFGSNRELTKTKHADDPVKKVENKNSEMKEPSCELLYKKEPSDKTSETKRQSERKVSPDRDGQSSRQMRDRRRSRDRYQGRSRSRDRYQGRRSRSRDRYRRSRSGDRYKGRSRSRDRYLDDRGYSRDINNTRRDDLGRKRRRFDKDDESGSPFNDRDEICDPSYRERKRKDYPPLNYSQNKRHFDRSEYKRTDFDGHSSHKHRTDANNDDIDGNEDDYWSQKRESTKACSTPINPWITNESTLPKSASLSKKELKDPEFLLRVLLQTSIMIQNNNLTMVNPMDALSLADKELVLQTLNELDQMPQEMINVTINDMKKFNAAENRVLIEAISNIAMFKAALAPPPSANLREENMEIDSDNDKEESPVNVKEASVYVSMTNIKPLVHKHEDVVKFLNDMSLKFDLVKIHASERNECTNGFIKFSNFANASEFLKRTNRFLYLGNDREGIKLDITDVLDKGKRWQCTFCSLKNLCATHVCSKCGKIKENLLDVQVTTEVTNKLILINFLKVVTVKNIKNVLVSIAPQIHLVKINLHTDSSNENVHHFIVVVENKEMGNLLRRSILENLEEFSCLRAGSKIALKFLPPETIASTAPSHSLPTGKRIYSLVDVPRLAQYSASLYAKNETEILHYYQHYTNLYTQELIKGNIINVILPEDSACEVQVPQTPNGTDGKYWPPPNESTFVYDSNSGYYFDHTTKLYYERSSKYFYNMDIGKFLQYDTSKCTYLLVQNSEISSAPVKISQNESNVNFIASNIIQPQISHPTDPTKTEELSDDLKTNPPTKESKIHAKKVMQDMKKWAKAVKKVDKKKPVPSSTITSENDQTTPADVCFDIIRKKSTPADVCFDLIRKIKSEAVKPVSNAVPPISSLILENVGLCEDEKEEQAFIDWQNFTCNLCHRVFNNAEILLKHSKLSELHKTNIKKWYISKDLDPDNEENRKRQYRNRALGHEKVTSPKTQEVDTNATESWLCSTPMCMAYTRSGYDTCLSCDKLRFGPVKQKKKPSMRKKLISKLRQRQGLTGKGMSRQSTANMNSNYLGLGAHEPDVAEPMEGERYVSFIRRMQQKRFEEASQRM